MTRFTDILTHDLRLVMLRLMAEDQGHSINESIIQDALDMYGHKVSRDKVRTEMRWLEEQGLITVEEVAGLVLVGKLTGRGIDCAKGRCHVDGVKSPRPKE